MLDEKRLTQLAEMEKILGESEDFFAQAENFLAQWQAFLPKLQQLENYYFDGDWREDVRAWENGEIPENQPCGVLTEDAVFNASVANRELATAFLQMVASVLATRES